MKTDLLAKYVMLTCALGIAVVAAYFSAKGPGSRYGSDSEYQKDLGDASNRVVTLDSLNISPSPLDSVNQEPEILLAEFGLTGDRRFLTRAQRLGSESLDVILTSALLADSPDSEWLAKIEELQPNNSFPNLLRAALYADEKNFIRFVEELRTGLSKSDFDTGLGERQALLLDAILSSGRFPESAISVADRAFLNRLNRIGEILFLHENNLFGTLEYRAQIGMEFAHKLRSINEFSFSYAFAAHLAEAEILHKFEKNDYYGSGGTTVQDRLTEMSMADKDFFRKFKKYSAMIQSPGTDPAVKAQFFSRMRADGEWAAVDWLMTQ